MRLMVLIAVSVWKLLYRELSTFAHVLKLRARKNETFICSSLASQWNPRRLWDLVLGAGF